MNQHSSNRRIKIFNLEDFCADSEDDFCINELNDSDAKNKKWSTLHLNHFSTIVFIKKGKGSLELNSKKYNLEDRSFLYLPQYVSYRNDWSGISEGLSVRFYDSFLMRKNEYPFTKFSFFLNTKMPVVLTLKRSKMIWQVIQLLKEEIGLGNISDKTIVRNLTELILLYLNRIILNNQKIIPVKLNKTVYEFIQLLNSSQGEIRPVSYFANLLGITPGHLSDTVKGISGRSASDFIKENVIRRAIELLEYSDFRISDIAIQLNFHDSAYFTRFFKKETGLTPSDFRKDRNPKFVHTNP
ncbi:helix-turn-helix domain-containing protein [Leptospira sp. 96542]|nr:helix-turn-helix domain-containing protein [Leptospira sp. 96542]